MLLIDALLDALCFVAFRDKVSVGALGMVLLSALFSMRLLDAISGRRLDVTADVTLSA